MKKQTLGMKIASLRKEHGMTQADLACQMGVTDKAVSKWERDLSCPDVNTLPKLSEIFQISVDELMQGKEINRDTSEKNKVAEIVSLVLKAVSLAMGVAVVVLSAMDRLDAKSAFTMLGIGLCCVGITLLKQDK